MPPPRLRDEEKKALAHALQGLDGEAYLYGSRTDPAKKGGDIDLLVFSRAPSAYRLSQDITIRFRMLCDEKIDVLVVNPEHVPPQQRPFLQLIQQGAVKIQ
ncbi:MAG: nucleotidyltransferase domain-containing protein [Lentisphaeria bacterium]|jgi:hypothetical protein